MDKKKEIFHTKNQNYQGNEEELYSLYKDFPLRNKELLDQLFLFITPQNMRRLFFHYEMYKKILSVPGEIMLFGVRWGRGAAIYDSLRTLFEPFNHSRKINSFDTFKGFISYNYKDKNQNIGSLNVGKNYEKFFEKIMRTRNKFSPIGHIKQYENFAGDASSTCKKYLKDNPQVIISLVHLDMNLYKPTKNCLSMVSKHLVKGSVVIIDELGHPKLPGQTIAVKELFKNKNVNFKRIPYTNPTWTSFYQVD